MVDFPPKKNDENFEDYAGDCSAMRKSENSLLASSPMTIMFIACTRELS